MNCTKCGKALPVVGRRIVYSDGYRSPMGHIHDEFFMYPEYGPCFCEQEFVKIKPNGVKLVFGGKS